MSAWEKNAALSFRQTQLNQAVFNVALMHMSCALIHLRFVCGLEYHWSEPF